MAAGNKEVLRPLSRGQGHGTTSCVHSLPHAILQQLLRPQEQPGARPAAPADLVVMKDTPSAPHCQRTGCFSIGS